ncbi:unnamed protein product [Symbiodinium sp. CCMP2592]|nr:unnamed protein product [Symbiodinium sp. CCMP2592]
MSANIWAKGTYDEKDSRVFAGALTLATTLPEEKMMKSARAGHASFLEDEVLRCNSAQSRQPVSPQSRHRSVSFETSDSSNLSASWHSAKSETRRKALPLQPGPVASQTRGPRVSGNTGVVENDERLQPAYPKPAEHAGFVILRITPKHFSPLGTTFRDVQVGFHSHSFVVRAVDCEGYTWTASSSSLPGGLVVDCCKFKIDPTGKDVTIHLCKADRDPKWWSVSCLELKRPYNQHKRPDFPRQDQASSPEASRTILQLHRTL